MITDAQYAAWLRNPAARRVLLVDLHHAAGVEYVASHPYISRPTDSAPNRIYNDLLADAVGITARMDAVPEIGDLVLIDDGSITDWAQRHWRGWPVVIRLGDPSWSLDDFRVIARQVSAGVLGASRGELRLGIYDAVAVLDTPVARDQLPDGQPVPLILGHVLGAGATRTDSATLTYCVSQLPLAGLVVRDGTGPVLTHTPNLAAGTFELAAYTPRAIWCEVQEPHNTPLQITQWVADQYDLQLAPGISLPDYILGLRYADEATGRQILDDVCQAIGGHWSVTLTGQIDVQVMQIPTTPDQTITADAIEFGRIQLTRIEEPTRQLALRYAKNHQPLTEIAGSIADADPALAERLRAEWHSAVDTNPVAEYPLAADQDIETALQNAADAQAETARRLAIRSVRREVWELDVFLPPDPELVGRSLQVLHPRLTGRVGRIISAALAPTREIATMEVWY